MVFILIGSDLASQDAILKRAFPRDGRGHFKIGRSRGQEITAASDDTAIDCTILAIPGL